MLLAPLVVDRVVGPGDEPDRGDLAAAAAGAVSSGGGVIVVAIEHQALGLAVGLDRAFEEAGRRVGRPAQEVEPHLQRLEQRRVLLAPDERMRSADVDALEAAGAFPRIDGGGEQAAAARGRFLHRVEEGPRLGDRERGQSVGELAKMAAQHGVVDVELARRLGHDLMERPRLLLAPIDFAHRVGERVDLAAQRLALGLRDVELADGGKQKVVDLVDRVRDRRIRAHQRAFHAAGAEIGDELRHVAPEQALVLEGGASRRHEQARARHDRRLGDGSVPERCGHDVFKVVGVEEAFGRRRSPGAAHRGRNQHGAAAGARGAPLVCSNSGSS